MYSVNWTYKKIKIVKLKNLWKEKRFLRWKEWLPFDYSFEVLFFSSKIYGKKEDF
jgi:hypothetical protein